MDDCCRHAISAFQFGGSGRVRFRWEMFNVIHIPNFGKINFGQITSADGRRIMWLYWRAGPPGLRGFSRF